jgi:hypothetical protein
MLCGEREKRDGGEREGKNGRKKWEMGVSEGRSGRKVWRKGVRRVIQVCGREERREDRKEKKKTEGHRY